MCIRDSYDAVIATGSDNSGRYFKKYFAEVPNVIRLNRNGVAVLFNDVSEEELVGLGDDILSYFGLGCRNVSKLYLEKGFDIQRVFAILEKHRDIIHHNHYKNNYDYNYAMYLLNNDDFLTNDFVILRKSNEVSSRIASLHYSYFDTEAEVCEVLSQNHDQIQCIVSHRALGALRVVPIGRAQRPALHDYADGVDTFSFLNNI